MAGESVLLLPNSGHYSPLSAVKPQRLLHRVAEYEVPQEVKAQQQPKKNSPRYIRVHFPDIRREQSGEKPARQQRHVPPGRVRSVGDSEHEKYRECQ